MKRRICYAFLASGVFALCWLVWIASSIWRFGHTDHAVKSDCAIVLGAATAGSEPSPVFEERIKHGITLYRDSVVKKVIFTGGFGEGASFSEGAVGAKYALAEGVPAEDVLFEEVSQTTRENLLGAKKLMDEKGLKAAVIVSDPLHLKRAQAMAKGCGINSRTSPTPTSRYRSLRTKSGFLLRELYFWHHYQLFGR